MTIADPKLLFRVVGWTVVFTVGTALLAAIAAPRLLLLHGAAETDTMVAILLSIGLGGLVASARGARALARHRFVLRALALGSQTVEPHEMEALTNEAKSIATAWVAPPLVSLGLLPAAWRPARLDVATATSVALLAAVIVASASLPLLMLLRTAFLRTLELADVTVMRVVVEQAEQRGLTHKRVARRLLIAVAAPVAMVAVGSALIASAHQRRADEREREETARALARAALEPGPGMPVAAGVEEAVLDAKNLGFSAMLDAELGEYRVERGDDGVVTLTTPLDAGSAHVSFSGSTVPVLTVQSMVVALLAVGIAGGFGMVFGRALSADLQMATQGVRGLSVGRGRRRLVRDARFRPVVELGRAIERLAGRFEVFARAQRKAIHSREAVTRLRGLFFASVSHDLKGPLNAILGFTEIVRLEPLTRDQLESLNHIESSGRELLALIETILDAARVEAKQLELTWETLEVVELFRQAVQVGRSLGGDRGIGIIEEIADGLPPFRADRIRMTRAIATFLGHALRNSPGPTVRLRADLGPDERIHITLEIPTDRARAHQLDAILDPSRRTGGSEPRGLALGIGLACTMIELHGGVVKSTRRDEGQLGTTSIVIAVPVRTDSP